jgi:hypothetical protein
MIIPTREVIKLQEFLLSETYRVLTRQNQIDLMQTLRAEWQKVDELTEMLKLLIGMCESIGTFKNGVEYQGMDQGDVQADQVLCDARNLLIDQKTT